MTYRISEILDRPIVRDVPERLSGSFGENEKALYVRGLCYWLTSFGTGGAPTYCGEDEDKHSSSGLCAEHNTLFLNTR